jgi:hypothetical protein
MRPSPSSSTFSMSFVPFVPPGRFANSLSGLVALKTVTVDCLSSEFAGKRCLLRMQLPNRPQGGALFQHTCLDVHNLTRAASCSLTPRPQFVHSCGQLSSSACPTCPSDSHDQACHLKGGGYCPRYSGQLQVQHANQSKDVGESLVGSRIVRENQRLRAGFAHGIGPQQLLKGSTAFGSSGWPSEAPNNAVLIERPSRHSPG